MAKIKDDILNLYMPNDEDVAHYNYYLEFAFFL